MRSMTGFGSGQAPLGGGRVVVDVRSVNHRFFEARVRLPSALSDHASAVEEILRRDLERGRVEASFRFEGDAGAGTRLDFAKAKAALADLAALRDAVAPGEPVPFALLGTVPELFRDASSIDADEARAAVAIATRDASKALDAMRRTEGAALHADLVAHLATLRGHAASFRARLPEIVDAQRTRLRERIRRLLEDTSVTLDEGRLEHEIALLADRSDVAEELARLESHGAQFDDIVRADASVGRKLDFLLQEVAREVNTLGSKTADAQAARLVVEMKTTVERMREQVQNVL